MTIEPFARNRAQGILVAAILFSTATAVWGGDEKLSADLRGHSQGNVDVIVQYRNPPTEAHHRRVLQAGGSLKHRLDFIRSAHYSVSPSLLHSLADDADVAYITPDRPVHGTLNITSATVYSTAANASGWTGKGIGVAVIDSGIADVADFQYGRADRLVYQQSFVKNPSPADQYGHGTHVAGILGAVGNRNCLHRHGARRESDQPQSS